MKLRVGDKVLITQKLFNLLSPYLRATTQGIGTVLEINEAVAYVLFPCGYSYYINTSGLKLLQKHYQYKFDFMNK